MTSSGVIYISTLWCPLALDLGAFGHVNDLWLSGNCEALVP